MVGRPLRNPFSSQAGEYDTKMKIECQALFY